jgi:hypothetical protein
LKRFFTSSKILHLTYFMFEGQHKLKKLELEEYDKKQKEANLSGFNVAEIMDAINERRRHMQPSEDDDSDGSEWDM